MTAWWFRYGWTLSTEYRLGKPVALEDGKPPVWTMTLISSMNLLRLMTQRPLLQTQMQRISNPWTPS
jgi:hypothetical protein